MQKTKEDVFENPEKHALTLPRDKAWDNWKKWESVGDEVKGYIRDVFFRPSEGEFQEQRGLTIEQTDGTLINVGVKRKPFILNKTDNLRLGDPLVMRFAAEKPSQTKGHNPTKIFEFFGKNLEENANNKTVWELEKEDMERGGTTGGKEEEEEITYEEDPVKEFSK